MVYRAIDREQGITHCTLLFWEKLAHVIFLSPLFCNFAGLEVAWNQVRLEQGTDFVKLWKEILILQQLQHPNIIQFHHSWIDEAKLQVVFITEWMTSGTLKQCVLLAVILHFLGFLTFNLL